MFQISKGEGGPVVNQFHLLNFELTITLLLGFDENIFGFEVWVNDSAVRQ